MPLLAALLLLAGGADTALRIWDADGDGALSASECPDPALFAEVDRDRDGKASREELAAYLDGERPAAPPPDARNKEPVPEKKPEAPAARRAFRRPQEFLARFDADGNGRIEKAEFRGGEEAFARHDRNRSGALELRELEAYLEARLAEAKRNPRPEEFLELFDANGDGKVVRAEYDGPRLFFRLYDRDRDDVVTEAELRAPAMPEAPVASASGDGPTPLPKRTLLERYDADGDGRVTLEELGGAENVLARLDRNGDGVLSGSEAR
jgi:Ca2+-binding EF-hand superfamily protein